MNTVSSGVDVTSGLPPCAIAIGVKLNRTAIKRKKLSIDLDIASYLLLHISYVKWHYDIIVGTGIF